MNRSLQLECCPASGVSRCVGAERPRSQELYPQHHISRRVNLEFNRVTGKSFIGEFFSALDGLYLGLEEVFMRKTGLVGQQLADLRKQKQSMEPTCQFSQGSPDTSPESVMGSFGFVTDESVDFYNDTGAFANVDAGDQIDNTTKP
ncbi:hypothetical protein DNTS_005262 [Danionella cerebrum]|uniref:Uncharacterized protein n=1 Tax=Danionella cerebrum TaxID=2873325 RepID=A0A553RE54_9TELE|nr:hypothetical protein DNTS_005262 [Danionella translucida]